MKKSRSACPSNSKALGLALQALTILADQRCRHASSHLADHLASEPTLIRRILARLAQVDILEVREGRDGGYSLKRSPASVTCADVYRALHIGDPFCDGLLDSAEEQPLGARMQEALSDIAGEVNQAVERALEQYTIADLVNKLDYRIDKHNESGIYCD
ncbi:Rrf2 family transcriptional regulator [Paenibacillus sp. 1P07SE]|uniref:Rrf2 family transcriptional regulator n=1 Tax=Paenibacillus sp. 1P07SE TaxID=3132209 RepID=UPI0039A53D67